MQLPLWILLIPYVLLLFIFAFWLGLNIYHLIRFGLFDFTGKVTLLIFSSLSIITIGFTALLLYNTEWTDTFDPVEIPAAIIPLVGNNTQNDIQ